MTASEKHKFLAISVQSLFCINLPFYFTCFMSNFHVFKIEFQKGEHSKSHILIFFRRFEKRIKKSFFT